MNTYKIIGGDQKEYGPVSADDLRQWIQQNRVNAQTQVQAGEGGAWMPLSAFPEFADVLAAQSATVGAPPGPAAASELQADLFARDYELDIGGCVGRGWNLLKANMGLLVCASLIYFGIEFAIGLLGSIPLIGPLFSLGNLFVVGPLIAGLNFITLQAIRRQPASAGDVFTGFRTCYWQLFLGQLVPGLLAGLCLIPIVVVGLIAFLPTIMHDQPPEATTLIIWGVVALVCVVPFIFLQVNWMFTLPLIIDKRLDFWPAMRTSWTMVRKHWWQVFGLLLIVGLLNVVGLILCCVGLLFSMPLGIGAMMYAYETMFSAPAAKTS
jgi:uncharacterized membrane protein